MARRHTVGLQKYIKQPVAIARNILCKKSLSGQAYSTQLHTFKMPQAYDQPIIDVAHYVFHYQIPDKEQAVWTCARVALLDAIGCAIETAATSRECRALLGPVVADTVVPNGFRVPGTELQVDPVKGAFDLGVLIRYLDHNDALGGAEWGHPSGISHESTASTLV